MRDALEVERLVQNGADLVEQLQFLDFGLRRGHGIVICSDRLRVYTNNTSKNIVQLLNHNTAVAMRILQLVITSQYS